MQDIKEEVENSAGYKKLDKFIKKDEKRKVNKFFVFIFAVNLIILVAIVGGAIYFFKSDLKDLAINSYQSIIQDSNSSELEGVYEVEKIPFQSIVLRESNNNLRFEGHIEFNNIKYPVQVKMSDIPEEDVYRFFRTIGEALNAQAEFD